MASRMSKLENHDSAVLLALRCVSVCRQSLQAYINALLQTLQLFFRALFQASAASALLRLSCMHGNRLISLGTVDVTDREYS